MDESAMRDEDWDMVCVRGAGAGMFSDLGIGNWVS